MSTKVEHKTIKPICEKHPQDNVHTLALLDHDSLHAPPLKESNQKRLFQKRAKAKAYSNALVFSLVDANPHSHLVKSYWNTYHCNNILLQEGQKVSASFCNNRWCVVCNRVRTAKLINGYKNELDTFKEPTFLTLSRPNIQGRYLRTGNEQNIKSLSNIIRNTKERLKTIVRAIRKVEITHNKDTKDFHPHYHFVIDGQDIAETIKNKWLSEHSDAHEKGQDIQPATDGTLLEIFKYVTKLVGKEGTEPKALNTIFSALRNKRAIQAYGLKKTVSENIEKEQTNNIDFKDPKIEIWLYDNYDWIASSGETFSDYIPHQDTIELIKSINLNYGNDKDRP